MANGVLVRATVEAELRAARAWAERHRVPLCWDAEALELRAVLAHPKTADKFYLRGEFDDYRELPPAWTFCSSTWKGTGNKRDFPKSPTPSESIFIAPKRSGPVICAPFNRLAYGQHGGPHKNWGGPAQWLSAAPRYVRATTIGDMLHVICRDLRHTQGTMA